MRSASCHPGGETYLRTLTQIILLSSGARVVQFNNKIGEG